MQPGDAQNRWAESLDAWRAKTLGAILGWHLVCGALGTAVFTVAVHTTPAYRSLALLAWGLIGVLAALAAARGLRFRLRAYLYLGVVYGFVLLSAASLRAGAIGFSHAGALAVLAGVLLGGRAGAAAAVLATCTLALAALGGALGLADVRPALAPSIDWVAAVAGAFPAVALTVLALRRMAGRLRDALESSFSALRDLEATRSHLAESERAELAGRLAGALAHDLNNTLTVVVANAEWLVERLAGREEAAAALEIRDAASSASALTQQVLLASRAGMSQARPLDLTRATTAAAGALRRLLPPDIQVETRLSGPVWTTFDPGQLQQVVLGVALSARAAMPGGGTLLLAVRPGGARRPGEPLPAAILEISDTGIGMGPEERQRAFEPLGPRGGGRGAAPGLAGVKALVEGAGGEVLLRSRPGAGTVVTLTLPGAQPEVPADEAAAPVRRARVLVVEDDIRIRALVCTALADAGHDVQEVSDGTQAMRAIEELGAVDLLVTDVVMPGVPVGEVIATFRARHPGGRILVCSAFSEDEGIRRRVSAGEYRLLPKPFTRSELLAEVQRVLAGAQEDAPAGRARAPAQTGVGQA